MQIKRLFGPDAEVAAASTAAVVEEAVVETAAGSEIEKMKSELKRARDEAAASRVELKKRQDSDAAAEAERATKAGEFEKLYQTTKKELDDTKTKAAKVEDLETKLKAMEDVRRKELLDRIPKDHRKTYECEDVSLGELERASKLFPSEAGKKTSTESGAASDKGAVAKPTTFDELAALQASGDTVGYQKALREMGSNKGGAAIGSRVIR